MDFKQFLEMDDIERNTHIPYTGAPSIIKMQMGVRDMRYDLYDELKTDVYGNKITGFAQLPGIEVQWTSHKGEQMRGVITKAYQTHFMIKVNDMHEMRMTYPEAVKYRKMSKVATSPHH